MSCPNFLHFQANGDVWFSLDENFVPAGSNLAVFRVFSDAKTQKLGTISGNSGAYACSGGTGRRGNEIT